MSDSMQVRVSVLSGHFAEGSASGELPFAVPRYPHISQRLPIFL